MAILCEDDEADFNEIVVIVEKDWLYDYMKTMDSDIKTDADCLKYLKNEYTSDDSYGWYSQAVLENKIVMIDFN